MSCPSSRARLQNYSNFILSNGAIPTDRREEADFILVDTCAYTDVAEKQSLDLVALNDRAAKPGAKVIACGCLGAINPKALTQRPSGDFFSPKTEKDFTEILGLPEAKLNPNLNQVTGTFMHGYSLAQHPPFRRLLLKSWTRLIAKEEMYGLMDLPLIGKWIAATQMVNAKAYGVSISQGCLGNCSFCVIPLSKGRTQSTAIATIVDKIRSLVDSGVKRIILTSEDIGAYGRDIGTNLIHLLEAIHEISGNFTLHCYNLDPRWLSHFGKDLIELTKRNKIRSFDIPIQSGSNAVLQRMIRAYEIEPVMEMLFQMKRSCPKVALATHLIAGFPGETESDFNQSRSIARSGLFDWVIVFPFSLRPGSQAVSMNNHLTPSIIKQRSQRLQWDWRISLVKRHWSNFSDRNSTSNRINLKPVSAH